MSHSDTPELLLDNQICFAVHATAHAFAQAYKPLLKAMNLTYPQYLVMLVLWERDDLSVSDIGQKLFLDSGTLTPLLKRLEALGYVQRTRDTADERVVRITLSDAGRSLKTQALCVPPALLAATELDIPGLQSLNRQVRRLGDALRSQSRPLAAGAEAT